MLSKLSSHKDTSSAVKLNRILDVLILFCAPSTFSKTPDLSQVAVKHHPKVMCWSWTALDSAASDFALMTQRDIFLCLTCIYQQLVGDVSNVCTA